MIARTQIALAGIAIAALAAAPAGAATVSFGPNLDNVTANSDATQNCAGGQPDLIFRTTGHTCMWTHLGSGSDTEFAPASGTVTTVRIKVGAITGPMRVNVVRFLFRQTGDTAHPFSAGPFLETYGTPFTPTANSVFGVTVNLAVKEDPTPAPSDLQTIQVIDGIALEMLSPQTPIPVFLDPGVLSYESYPGPTEAGVPAPSPNGIGSGTIGYGVEMNADLDTGAGAQPPVITPPTTPGPGAIVPAFGFAKNLTAPVTANAATVPVQCLVTDCAGQLTLQSAKPATARAAKSQQTPKITTYGSARFTAKAGRTAKVKVRLNAKGRGLLRHHRSAKVWAYAKFTKGAGAAKSAHITLKKH